MGRRNTKGGPGTAMLHLCVILTGVPGSRDPRPESVARAGESGIPELWCPSPSSPVPGSRVLEQRSLGLRILGAGVPRSRGRGTRGPRPVPSLQSVV